MVVPRQNDADRTRLTGRLALILALPSLVHRVIHRNRSGILALFRIALAGLGTAQVSR